MVDRLQNKVLELTKSDKFLRTYTSTQSLLFSGEGLFLPAIDMLVNKRKPKTIFDDKAFFDFARGSIQSLLQSDLDRINRGLYPESVLWGDRSLREQLGGAVAHAQRLPKLFKDGIRAAKARNAKSTQNFATVDASVVAEKPEYYQRNFHFQNGGYLSEESAELYDHQVDVLFGGAADAMRRLILEPISNHFQSQDGGANLHFLEIGSGTGRATLALRLMYPKAKITSLDLSSAYLKKAEERLKKYSRHDFIEGKGEELPFKDQTFDGVFSVFLYHELPFEVRQRVIAEQHRVLKAGGFFGLVDSLQLGDVPQFDDSLREFPRQYHEPFYKNYISKPMSELVKTAGFQSTAEDYGFLSKVVWAQK